MNIEYMLYPIILNFMNNLKDNGTNIQYCLILFCFFLYKISNNFNNILDYINEYFFENKEYIIEFTSEDKDQSLRFKALMHYLSYKKNPTIKKIKELAEFRWDYNDDWAESNNWYQVDQKFSFKFKKDIYGKVFTKRKEKRKNNRDETEYKNYCTLKLYSTIYDLQELQKFTENCVLKYKEFLKSKSCSEQLLITVNYEPKEENIDITSTKWESSIKFENSYFKNKKQILNTIDHFLQNKNWFIERGQPYNLGILLYGEPGGGKTRFIKQLINYTGRHGIDIKLHDKFDLTELRKIIHTENIGKNYIIPQKERILIFEDVDSIGDLAKDRDKKNKLSKEQSKKNSKESNNDSIINSIITKNMEDTKKSNNNLSYFLNILDGLNECSGRIIIMTTNKIEELDKALIRPGRIDVKIEFKKCDINDIYNMGKLYWKEKFKYKKNQINSDVNLKYTSAEIINKFKSLSNIKDFENEFIDTQH